VDPDGSFAPLHRFNPTRLGFYSSTLVTHFGRDLSSLRPFEGLALLDIGCGGGLIAEPMSRLGFRVTAIDGTRKQSRFEGPRRSDRSVRRLPSRHPESVAETDQRFDVVLASRSSSNVADPAVFLGCVGVLGQTGGAFIGAHVEPPPPAPLPLAIVGAEYLLGWLPRGTHDWRRFIRPRKSSSACAQWTSLHPPGPASATIWPAGSGRFRGFGGQLHGHGGAAVNRAGSASLATPKGCGQS